MKTLVTGDAGFIGFHAARAFLQRGDEVMGYDSITHYYDPELKKKRLALLADHPRFSHITAELRDAETLSGVVRDFQPDIVVHLAAQAGVRYSLEQPRAYIESNVIGTFNLLEAVRETKPAHLLIASTSSVYGGNKRVPFGEIDRADSPVSLYAATKKSAEALAHSYAHLWQIPTTAFRFFTVYGPWGRPDMALYKFVRAIEKDQPIDVYGHGRMSRDFTFIDDLIATIVRLSAVAPETGNPLSPHDSLSDVAPYRVVNLGAGKPVPLMAFISAVEQAMGKTAQMNMLPMQPGDVVKTDSDVALLRDLVGEIPYTPVDEGVRMFVNWYEAERASR